MSAADRLERYRDGLKDQLTGQAGPGKPLAESPDRGSESAPWPGRGDRRGARGGRSELIEPEWIVELHHGRGRDELVHRALGDFRDERLPFQSFRANAVFYYTALVAFSLFEAFKRDVTEPVLPPSAYAIRFRRQVIDVAAKIVPISGEIILKVTDAVWERLRIEELWDRTADPPRFARV